MLACGTPDSATTSAVHAAVVVCGNGIAGAIRIQSPMFLRISFNGAAHCRHGIPRESLLQSSCDRIREPYQRPWARESKNVVPDRLIRRIEFDCKTFLPDFRVSRQRSVGEA